MKYVNSQITDKNARILILNLTLDQSEYIPVNIYKENTESKQLEKLSDISELMKKCNITYGKQIVLAGNFNLLFDNNLEAKGGKPILKEKSVARIVELKEEYDLIYVISGELETYSKNHLLLKQAS